MWEDGSETYFEVSVPSTVQRLAKVISSPLPEKSLATADDICYLLMNPAPPSSMHY